MIKKELHEGEIYPKFYGFGYYDIQRNVAVCYPVPLNILVGLIRNFFIAVRHGVSPSRDYRFFRAGRLRGRRLERENIEYLLRREREEGFKTGYRVRGLQ